MTTLTSVMRPCIKIYAHSVRPNAFLLSKSVLFQRCYRFFKDSREIVCAAAPRPKVQPHAEPPVSTEKAKRKTVSSKHKLPLVNHTTEHVELEKVSQEAIPPVSPQISVVSGTHTHTLPLEDDHQTKNEDINVQVLDFRNLPRHYMKLSKIRLTGLVVVTTVAGYGIAPAPLELQAFLLTILGTGLMSCSANAINQFLEIPYDSQMSRTKNRVLVRGYLTPLHAATFALACGSCGLSLLYCGVNGLTAALGLANLILYTAIYTPMKRYSILNTWAGSVVGAIPPVMGWTACTGALDPGSLFIGTLLFSWQFPHFNALSWNLRPDYSRAGYRMMSVTDPDLCRRTALRHSLAILVLCYAAPLAGLANPVFALTSLPLNAYLVFRAWRFYRDADSASSRKLFRFSLVHIPLLLTLLFVGKLVSNTSGAT